MSESIKARFVVTPSFVTILATFHECQLTIRWRREADSARHVRALVSNLGEMVEDGLKEVFVQDQTRRLDFEIEELFTENDKESE